MSDQLLGGHTLPFYQWEGDVVTLLNAVRQHIDEMAANWSAADRQACLEETVATFKMGAALMSYMKHPDQDKPHD